VAKPPLKRTNFEAVVIGTSTGGMEALRTILQAMPSNFPLPIIVVQHLHPHSDNFLSQYLNEKSELTVKQADEKENIEPGVVYLAPPNYHLLIETDKTFSLSTTPRVNYARPAIDVLFDTAADAYGEKLIGIVLTGANDDGSRGLKRIKEMGGLAIVQDPATAEISSMPKAAIAIANVDYILPLDQIAPFLAGIIFKPKDSDPQLSRLVTSDE
jgi:two-component system, chemotaxis family, protein-glutamate methylesterase/glutaminase